MNRLANFFQGRYGIDKLFYFLFILSAIIAVINVFTQSWILQIIVYAICILAIIRALSRNYEKRRNENDKFCQIFHKISSKFKLLHNMWKDRKTHCYVKCDCCKKILRLPKKKGVHTVKCPNCLNQFEVKI